MTAGQAGRGATLAQAIAISDEARAVISAEAPYSIVHTNRAWSETTGFAFLDVVGKSLNVLQGRTPTNPGPQGLYEALARRASPYSGVMISYRSDGTPFRNHVRCEIVQSGSHWLCTMFAEPIVDGSVERRAPVAETLSNHAPSPPKNYTDPETYENARKRPKRSGSDKYRLADLLGNEVDPIVVCSVAPPHEIIHPNQPWLEMCGYTLEEVEGVTNKILTGAETDDEALGRLLDCVRRREPSVQTLVNYKKGGVRFLNQVRTVPVYDEQDEVAAFASMLREIDESHIGASATGGCDHLWAALCARLDVGGVVGDDNDARTEAARKLIDNHEPVLADMTAVERSPSQPTLERVPGAMAGYAGQALREVCRILILGDSEAPIRGYAVEALRDGHPSRRAQQATWAHVATYLDQRIQTKPHPSGRPADMSEAAGTAMRKVLRKMAREAAAAI